MNRVIFIAAILLLSLAAIPDVHATLRIQSVSSGLFNFDGPTRATYAGDDFQATYNRVHDRAYVGAASNRGGPAVGVALQRPVRTQQHYFEDQNRNYRTREYGNWQVTQAHGSWPDQQSSVRFGQSNGYASIHGNFNGYTVAPSWGSPNAFARTHGMRHAYPQTDSGFGYTRSRSTYISNGRAYY